MTTPPQPPVTPGPKRPYTLGDMMPAPVSPPAGHQRPPYGPPPGYPPPPHGWRPPPPPRPPAKQPTRGPMWWRRSDQATRIIVVVAAIVAPLIIGGALFATLTRGAPDTIDFDVTACTFDSTGLNSVKTEFTVTNSGSRSHRLKIRWEYRDSSGARIDTDTSYVTVPAGDTIRDSETTLLPVAVSGGTCEASVS